MKYTLTTNPLVENLINNQHVWSLSMTFSTDIENMPNEIFVYQRFPGGLLSDTFQCVASVPQLSELGLDPIILETVQIPFYRTDTLRLDFRCQVEAEKAKEVAIFDTDMLVRNFLIGQDMDEQDVIEVIL